MKHTGTVEHDFVEFVPAQLAPATLYISIPYATCSHLCLCGCGQKVVTPLSPTDWALTYDGETVSLHPSVGNWSLDCESHYVIKRSRVIWADHWSRERVDANRARARRAKQWYFGGVGKKTATGLSDRPPYEQKTGLLRRLLARMPRVRR